MSRLFFFVTFFLFFLSCKTSSILENNSSRYPRIVDTRSVSISSQNKEDKVFEEGLKFINDFPGARLNDIKASLDGQDFTAFISPENEPINSSPWYAFKIVSDIEKDINISLDYGAYKHRYMPKYSTNGKLWQNVIDTFYNVDSLFTFTIPVTKDTLWISAQELFTIDHLNKWMDDLKSKSVLVSSKSIGESTSGRPLVQFSLIKDNPQNKKTIVFLSRQHPPEVTGQFALVHFVNSLVDGELITDAFFDKYNVIIYPMVNPDGVEEGHWRHNMNGVDLNRDWALYNQIENRQIAESIHKFSKTNKSKVVLGIDFHSTWEDVYYTNVADANSTMPNFTKDWINEIKTALVGYDPKVAPSNIGAPVSKNWFFIEFGAVGITYEIGDDTDREFIKTKSKIAKDAMIKILLKD